MKKNFLLLMAILVSVIIAVINGCKKDSSVAPPTDIGIRTSFTEEFEDMNAIPAKGWITQDNSSSLNGSGPFAGWVQGGMGYDKLGGWSGFTAYSYTTFPDEFAYSLVTSNSNNKTVSGWLITPVLSVKDGDKISFYTRGDTAGVFKDRMQVLMNNSSSDDVGNSPTSKGTFSKILLDINSAQAASGYPVDWTKYEYTFSGINGRTDTRIAFRHFVTSSQSAKGIGVDLFKFQVN